MTTEKIDVDFPEDISQNEAQPKSKSNAFGDIDNSIERRKIKFQLLFLGLVICVLVLTFLLGFYSKSFHSIIDGVAVKMGYNQPKYVVVIDAGSSGSRVNAFEFYNGYFEDRLILNKKLFVKTKPGISFYHAEPNKAAESIEKLLVKAKEFVPEEYWSSTPLLLRATAGLRLLSAIQAENLFNAVREVFVHSGFLIKDDAIGILDGVDEGIYSWFTINFLLDRLGSQNTVTALDMGGGSAQVTFAINDPIGVSQLADHLYTVSTPITEIDVFTNSYLNLGLFAARHTVYTSGHTNDNKTYSSECVNPIIESEPFEYGAKIHFMNGKNYSNSIENPVVDFDTCAGLIKKKILHLVNPKPITLNQHQIVATNKFWKVALLTGLVDSQEGGELTVADIVNRAKEVCATADKKQPFMCSDLTYISVLLKDGYGLGSGTKIKFFDKIGDNDISWTLGCAYSLLADMSRDKKAF